MGLFSLQWWSVHFFLCWKYAKVPESSTVRHHYHSTSGYFHSRMRCISSFNLFTNEISLSFRVRLKSKSVSEGRIRSKHSTNHMLRRISYWRLLAGGLFNLWQDETVRRANSSLSQWITWTRTIRSLKRFVQKERFVHERNIIILLQTFWCIFNVLYKHIYSLFSLKLHKKYSVSKYNVPQMIYFL